MDGSAKINPVVHFLVGGVAGAAGTIATSPLEFLKTRLQSTTGQQFLAGGRVGITTESSKCIQVTFSAPKPSLDWSPSGGATVVPRVVRYFGHIYSVEGGVTAFFKGLRPALLGIIPSRAIYFVAYSRYKDFYNGCFAPNSDSVHLLSAMSTGITMSSFTSPIWVIKTKMQLDTRAGKSSPIIHYIHNIWKRDGFRGFYRGLSASYAGCIETGVYFVLYERLKSFFAEKSDTLSPSFSNYLVASSVSKFLAVLMCYPHEVVRTRLRQDHHGKRKYYSFAQTLLTVWRDEGFAGVYGGMSLHLLRAVPNTAITFLAYEAIISLITLKTV